MTWEGKQPGRRIHGFSLVELLVVIAVIVILLMLLLPAIGSIRARSRQAQCASNQKQVYDAWYRATFNLSTPITASVWPDKVKDFGGVTAPIIRGLGSP
jgi:prepilin-type N-terminal cleavage/methylation domain-containing protein